MRNTSNWTGRAPRSVIGERFRMLIVLAELDRVRAPSGRTKRVVAVRCDCGTEKSVHLASLREGTTVSCGCYHIAIARARLSVAARTHGQSRTPLYRVWVAMKKRCSNPNSDDYGRYGGRGIEVCERWRNDFAAFAADVGERPNGQTLDRINNDGHYEPGNVRWATYQQQARNNRRNHLYTMNGETRCLAEWCEITGELWTTVKKRVAAGRDPFVRQRRPPQKSKVVRNA